MIIEPNAVVTFHYRLSESSKDVIEDSHNTHPMVYMHGHNSLLAGLEQALAGKKTGDQVHVTLTPDQAYGPRVDDAIQRVPIKHVLGASKKKTKFVPGMIVQINTQHGPRQVVVVKAGMTMIDVDTNHPLAGKTLVFDISIVDVRAATAEEIAHGHVHGEGGHHH